MTSEISSEESEAKVKEIESFIQSKEGVILTSDKPVAKTLAYPIKKQGSGFFSTLTIQIEEEKVAELNEKLVKDSKILRHFIVVKEAVRERKERRTRAKPAFTVEAEKVVAETKLEPTEEKASKKEEKQSVKSAASKEKADLTDIEKKLDEILSD